MRLPLDEKTAFAAGSAVIVAGVNPFVTWNVKDGDLAQFVNL